MQSPQTPTGSRVSPDEDIMDRSAIERAERVHVALLDRRVRLDGASHIRPLMDVIAEGSRSEKLEALRVVYRRYEAGLSTVLKRALQDSDTSVRVLAATVIAKLQRHVQPQHRRIARRRRRQPRSRGELASPRRGAASLCSKAAFWNRRGRERRLNSPLAIWPRGCTVRSGTAMGSRRSPSRGAGHDVVCQIRASPCFSHNGVG